VPTGTVDLSTTTLYSVIDGPMLRAAGDHVPQVRPSVLAGRGAHGNALHRSAVTARATSVVKCRRPAATFALDPSASPGS